MGEAILQWCFLCKNDQHSEKRKYESQAEDVCASWIGHARVKQLTNCYMIGTRKRASRRRGHGWVAWFIKSPNLWRNTQRKFTHGQCSKKFQDFLYKSGSYYVDEVVPRERYVAKHFDSDIQEKWCKVQYEVSVSDGYYTCECGMYEYMGMLCCHVLKVLVYLRFTEIPALHVMKRWTVDAQDVLTLHQVQYQKNQGLMTSFSFWHS